MHSIGMDENIAGRPPVTATSYTCWNWPVDFCPNIPYELLTPNHLLYDLLYNPNVTLFMKKGEAQGAVVKNGLEMLLLQAFAAWEIWHK